MSEDGVEGWDCTVVGLLIPYQYRSHPLPTVDVGVKGSVAGGVSEGEVQFERFVPDVAAPAGMIGASNFSFTYCSNHLYPKIWRTNTLPEQCCLVPPLVRLWYLYGAI